jgi:ribosomal protein L12E/L44/L45/RPP1/RPP2
MPPGLGARRDNDEGWDEEADMQREEEEEEEEEDEDEDETVPLLFIVVSASMFSLDED